MYNIKIYLKEMGNEGVDLIHLTRGRGPVAGFVNTAGDLQVPHKAADFSSISPIINFSKRTLSHKLSYQSPTNGYTVRYVE
jgi:hypothetical protein